MRRGVVHGAARDQLKAFLRHRPAGAPSRRLALQRERVVERPRRRGRPRRKREGEKRGVARVMRPVGVTLLERNRARPRRPRRVSGRLRGAHTDARPLWQVAEAHHARLEPRQRAVGPVCAREVDVQCAAGRRAERGGQLRLDFVRDEQRVGSHIVGERAAHRAHHRCHHLVDSGVDLARRRTQAQAVGRDAERAREAAGVRVGHAHTTRAARLSCCVACRLMMATRPPFGLCLRLRFASSGMSHAGVMTRLVPRQSTRSAFVECDSANCSCAVRVAPRGLV